MNERMRLFGTGKCEHNQQVCNFTKIKNVLAHMRQEQSNNSTQPIHTYGMYMYGYHFVLVCLECVKIFCK